MEMTTEAQRIAIAEACGKKYHKPTEAEIASGSYYQYEPDYLNDLNAMHEAEKVLTDKNMGECRRYCDNLRGLGGEELSRFGKVHASAAQRAEAFLRTLGLWK